MEKVLIAAITIIGLAFVQNISFSIVSRSRNRDNMKYHIIAATLSNVLWFLTFKQLILSDMAWYMLPGYALGTVAGSVYGVKISMKIEKWLGATADGHVAPKHDMTKDMKNWSKGVADTLYDQRMDEINKRLIALEDMMVDPDYPETTLINRFNGIAKMLVGIKGDLKDLKDGQH